MPFLQTCPKVCCNLQYFVALNDEYQLLMIPFFPHNFWPGFRDVDQSLFRLPLQEGVLRVDLPVAQAVRVVRGCVAWDWEEGRDACPGDAHFRHAVLQQIRSSHHNAGTFSWCAVLFPMILHIAQSPEDLLVEDWCCIYGILPFPVRVREPLSASFQEEPLHRTQSHESFRPARHTGIPALHQNAASPCKCCWQWMAYSRLIKSRLSPRTRADKEIGSLSWLLLQLSTIGVLSCGPKQMTENVGNGCEQVNRDRDYPRLLHHYENF